MFNPDKKTEVFHEAKYKVFLQMGHHQREYRYCQYTKLTNMYFSNVLITKLNNIWSFFKVANFRELMNTA